MNKLKLKLLNSLNHPSLEENIKEWGYEIVDSVEEAAVVSISKDVNAISEELLEYTDKEVFSFSEQLSTKDFVKRNGRLIFDPSLFKTDLGYLLLKRKLNNLFSTNLDDHFTNLYELRKFNIESHVEAGYYSDMVAIPAYERGYNIYGVREVINNMIYYFEYLERSDLGMMPIEMSVGFSEDFCIIQCTASSWGYRIQHLLNSLNEDDLSSPVKTLFNRLFKNSTHLEIFHLEIAGKLSICSYIAKEEIRWKYRGLTIDEIPKAKGKDGYEKDLNIIMDGYINNLEDKANALKSAELPGDMLSVFEMDAHGIEMVENPGKMMALAKFVKDEKTSQDENFQDFDSLNTLDIHEIAKHFYDQDFVTGLANDDYTDVKSILTNDGLLNSFQKLLDENKIVVSGENLEELEQVFKFNQSSVIENENIMVQGHGHGNIDEENIVVKGSGPENLDENIRVSGAIQHMINDEIIRIIDRGEIDNGKPINSISSILTAEHEGNEEEYNDFIKKSIERFENLSGIQGVNDKIKTFSKFDQGALDSKNAEISILNDKINNLEKNQRIYDEVSTNSEVELELSEELAKSQDDISKVNVDEILGGKTLTDFEAENIKRTMEIATELIDKNKQLEKDSKHNELYAKNLEGRLDKEIKKVQFDSEKRLELLLKTKDLLGKKLESKDKELEILRKKYSNTNSQLEKAQSDDYRDEVKIKQLESEVSQYKGRCESLSRQIEESSSKATDLTQFVEIKKQLEVALKEKDNLISSLEEKIKQSQEHQLSIIEDKVESPTLEDKAPVESKSEVASGQVMSEFEMYEMKNKLEEKEAQLKDASVKMQEVAGRVRELEHKLKMSQSVSKGQDKEIALLKNKGGSGSGNESKKIKHLEKLVEKAKEEKDKVENSVKETKKQLAKFKSENTALKNEMNGLKQKLKRAA